MTYVVTVKCTDAHVAYRFQAKMIILDYGKLDQILCGLEKWLDMNTSITKVKVSYPQGNIPQTA